MASKKEVAVQLMEHLCNHDYHGYSQPHRCGDGDGYCYIEVDGVTYQVEQGDRDCSSAIINAFESAGISCGGASYTGNMRERMTATGNFKWHPMSDGYVAQRGDVYLNEADHTAMCVSAEPDLLAEFSISETNGIDGATGDQTGRESSVHAYYNYPWDGILECVADGNASTPSAPSVSEDVPIPKYRAKVNDMWLDWMHGLMDTGGSADDYAGILGQKIQDIEFDNLCGGWFRLTLSDGTVLARNEQNNTNKFIRGVEVYYNTPNPSVTGYYKAKYRVHTINGTLLKWEYDDEDGGAGDDVNIIDGFSLTLESE